ncbi:MAG: hypothetical protein IBJ18_07165 [Phycisphaerales bacterium]|nr:hypothetical protein [Phycisphaerales bacterium]
MFIPQCVDDNAVYRIIHFGVKQRFFPSGDEWCFRLHQHMPSFHRLALFVFCRHCSPDSHTRVAVLSVIAEHYREARYSWMLDLKIASLPKIGQIEISFVSNPLQRPMAPSKVDLSSAGCCWGSSCC